MASLASSGDFCQGTQQVTDGRADDALRSLAEVAHNLGYGHCLYLIGGLAVVDSLVSVLFDASTGIWDRIRSTTREETIALLVTLVLGFAAPIVRDRVQLWGTQYVNRFIRRGLKRIAAGYAFWLAGILFASTLALIEFRRLLPDFTQGAILGSAITATAALTVMGWQARGPSRPNAVAFGRIFYEPATVVLTPLIVRRLLPTEIWQQIAEISLRFVG